MKGGSIYVRLLFWLNSTKLTEFRKFKSELRTIGMAVEKMNIKINLIRLWMDIEKMRSDVRIELAKLEKSIRMLRTNQIKIGYFNSDNIAERKYGKFSIFFN